MTYRIKAQISECNLSPTVLTLATQQCAYTGRQFGKGKGLGEIIIRSCIQTGHNILCSGFGSQHQHRTSIAGLAHFLYHRNTVFFGEHHIQNDQAEITFQGLFEAISSIMCNNYFILVFLKPAFDETGNLFFVFNH